MSLDPQMHRGTSDRQGGNRRRASTTSTTENPSSTAGRESPYVVVRKLTLSHASEPFRPMREITQLHYSSWPDFGAPAKPSHLLALVELTNALQRGFLAPGTHARADEPESAENSRPILVHCSAGCGRTGTFCTVDTVIDMLKRQRKEAHSGVTPMEISGTDGDSDYMVKGRKATTVTDDWVFKEDVDLVEKTVEDFREQRISMVQSLRQYVLCYETVLEWIAQQHHGGEVRRERSGSESRTGS